MEASELAVLQGDRANLAFFLRAEVGGAVIRLYAGVGDFPLAADGIETDGGLYLCAGRWAEGMPDVDHLMNGEVQAITLSLSGVDRDTAKGYITDRDQIIGAPAALGWCALDTRYRPAGPVRWPVRGILTQPGLSRRKATPTTWNRILSVVLTTGPVGRRRPPHTYYTGPDQRRRSATDAFCDRTGQLSFESTRKWPD